MSLGKYHTHVYYGSSGVPISSKYRGTSVKKKHRALHVSKYGPLIDKNTVITVWSGFPVRKMIRQYKIHLEN